MTAVQLLVFTVVGLCLMVTGYAIGLGSSNIAYRAVGRRDTAPNRITIVNRRGFCGETLRTLRP